MEKHFILNNLKEQKKLFTTLLIMIFLLFLFFGFTSISYTVFGCLLTFVIDIFIIEPIKIYKLEKDYINITKDIIDNTRLIVFQLFKLVYGSGKEANADANFKENIQILEDIKKHYPPIFINQPEQLNKLKQIFKFLNQRVPNLRNNLGYVPSNVRISIQRILILNGIINNLEEINLKIQSYEKISQNDIGMSLQNCKEINDTCINLFDNLMKYFKNIENDKLLKDIYYPIKKHLFFKEDLIDEVPHQSKEAITRE